MIMGVELLWNYNGIGKFMELELLRNYCEIRTIMELLWN